MSQARNRYLTGMLFAAATACFGTCFGATDAAPAPAEPPAKAAKPMVKKKPMKMKEPMAGEMKKPGMMKGDVEKSAERKEREMDEKMKKEEGRAKP